MVIGTNRLAIEHGIEELISIGVNIAMANQDQGRDLNSLNKILSEKMRSSANDQHYFTKYWLRFNPNDTNSDIGNAMTKLLLLPIWLPYHYWSRKKKKREMIDFVVAGTGEKLADNELRQQLALKWVELHPGDFVLGKYDPKLPQLEDTFQRILSRTHDLQPSSQVSEYIETGARAASIRNAGNTTESINMSLIPHVMRVVGMIIALGGALLTVSLVFIWLLS